MYIKVMGIDIEESDSDQDEGEEIHKEIKERRKKIVEPDRVQVDYI